MFVRDLYNKGEVSRQEAFTLSGIDNFYVFDDIWNNRTFTHIKSSIKNNHKKFKRIKGCQTGTKNNASKLTDDKVDLIKEQKLLGKKPMKVYSEYGFNNFISKNTFYRWWGKYNSFVTTIPKGSTTEMCCWKRTARLYIV